MNKTLLTIVFISLFSDLVLSQTYDCDWNWEPIGTNSSGQFIWEPGTWNLYIESGGNPNWQNPFQAYTNPSEDITRIINSNDFKKEDGWVLLYRDFGHAAIPEQGIGARIVVDPYFVLYNKHTGVMRLFLFNTNSELTLDKALIKLTWANNTEPTSLLTNSRELCRPNDAYPSLTDDKSIIIINSFTLNNWIVADFLTHFDYTTNASDGKYHQLKLSVYDIKTSSLQIETEINLESKSIELKGNSKGEKVTDQHNQIKTWTLNKNKAIAKLDDEEIKKKLENVQEGLTGFGSFVGDSALIKNMKKAADFIDPDKGGLGKKLIEGGKALGSVNSTVGFVFDVLDVFMGKPAGSSTPQTVKLYPFSTTGTASSTGSITTQGYRDERVFDIPGTLHSTFNTNTPYWDCPLGVFGLMESPKIVYRNCKSEPGYVNPGVGNCQGGYVEDIQNMKDYKTYKIVDNLKIALNPASEMDILSCEAAFIGKVKERIFNGDTIPAYNIYRNPYRYDWECDDYFDNRSYTNNFIYTCLRNGQYIMSEKDSAGFHKFRTPYINIENFKNTSFTVHKDIKIFIRLKLILQKKGSPDSPLMPVSIAYDLTNFELDNSSKEIFPFIRAQLSEVNVLEAPLYYRYMHSNSSHFTSDLVYRGNEFKKISSSTITSGSYSDGVLETNGNVNVNAINGNVLFNANYSISLKPGFTATVGNGKYFKASIVNNSNIIDNSFTPLSSLIIDNFTYPNCNCDGSLKSAKISKEKNNVPDKHNIPNGINVYPNPTNNYVNVELHGFEECTIQVFNMQGLVLYESKQNSASFEIDLTNYSDGLYFILAKTNNSSYSTKILKQ